MKKIRISIALLLISAGVFAQQTTTTTTTTTNNQNSSTSTDDKSGNGDCSNAYIGIRFMPTLTSMDINQPSYGTIKSTFVLGYGFGGYIGYNFNKHIGVQGEVLYSSLSQKFSSNGANARIDLSYINIPLLLSLNTNSCGPVNFNIAVGPQIGINTGSKLKTEGGEGVDSVTAVLAVKPGDLGFAYGAGIDFRVSPSVNLGIGFRGVYGLVDISNNNKSETTNQYYILDRSHVQTYSAYIGLGVKF